MTRTRRRGIAFSRVRARFDLVVALRNSVAGRKGVGMSWQLQEGDWCHVEIPTRDAPRARQFYEDVFGWKFSEFPGVQLQEIETSPGGIRSTLGTLGQEEKIVPFVLVKSDMDGKLKELETAGGSVVKPRTEVRPFGQFAYVTDPEGHLFGLWQDAPSEDEAGSES
jgi:predicted enzyme related to lactoylglutathione lyase